MTKTNAISQRIRTLQIPVHHLSQQFINNFTDSTIVWLRHTTRIALLCFIVYKAIPHFFFCFHCTTTTIIMSSFNNLDGPFKVESENCKYSEDAIISNYTWVSTLEFFTLCFVDWFVFILFYFFIPTCLLSHSICWRWRNDISFSMYIFFHQIILLQLWDYYCGG